jgi:hypothetical protein
MKYIKLDQTGHTEIDYAADQMIAQLEKDMAGGAVAVIAHEPDKGFAYLRRPSDVKKLSDQAAVTVVPQLVGG